MRYLLLLHGDEEAENALSADDRRAIADEHIAFGRRLREEGAYVTGEALAGSADARVLRLDDEGKPQVMDGPFAETKEQMGGFYVIDCGGVEDALRWAEQVPKGPGLVVEIRPIVDV